MKRPGFDGCLPIRVGNADQLAADVTALGPSPSGECECRVVRQDITVPYWPYPNTLLGIAHEAPCLNAGELSALWLSVQVTDGDATLVN
jgi:hypothetical protein